MQALGVNKTLLSILSKYSKTLLTVSPSCVHNSPNTPAKPMLFSNIMLKLSGLFFACYILPLKRLVDNQQSYFAGLFKGISA